MVFPISIWGGLELCFGELSPLTPSPRCDGIGLPPPVMFMNTTKIKTKNCLFHFVKNKILQQTFSDICI